MLRTKLFAAVALALIIGAIGVVVVRAEFFGNTTVVNTQSTIAAPNKGWLEQHIRTADQAAKRSADESIRSACAALQKLGTTDPECAKLSSSH